MPSKELLGADRLHYCYNYYFCDVTIRHVPAVWDDQIALPQIVCDDRSDIALMQLAVKQSAAGPCLCA